MDNKNIQEFHLGDFSNSIGGCFLESDIMFAAIGSSNRAKFNQLLEEYPDIKSNMLNFILVLDGELSISIDYIPYKIGKNTLLEISPFNRINHAHLSDDFSGYLIMASRNFISDTLADRKPIPISQFLDLREKPYGFLTDEGTAVIRASMEKLEYYLKIPEHTFKKDLIFSSFHIFILETANLFINKDTLRDKPRATSRKDVLIQQFLRLLHLNGKKEHSPSFYSDKMCISVQYLSLILKEISGQTAGAWIAGNLIMEAKKLLRVPDYSIQQVSESLYFSDQSAFGKFFKKHVGISPKKYKEEYASGGK